MYIICLDIKTSCVIFFEYHVLYIIINEIAVFVIFKDERENLDEALYTKAGEEPKLVTQLDDNGEPITCFVVADGMIICKMEPDIPVAVLTLMATYFLIDLHYPLHYAQTLGLLQHICLEYSFPEKERKTGFVTLLNLF